MVYCFLAAAVLLFFNCGQTTAVSSPGFRAAITDKGLDYLQVVGIPLLKNELASITIADISGKASIKVGHIRYNLKNIKLTDFNIGSSSLKTSPGQGLTLKAGDISIGASADWSYKGPLGIRDHGSVTASAGSITLDISILVGADATGHPNVTTTGCSFDAGHLKVKLHGGASWFYNLFDKTISDAIRKALNRKVCDLATKSINTAANKALATIPIVVQIDKVLELNYALTRSPDFNDTFIMTYHKGEFLSVSNPTIEAPFSPPPLPPYSGSNKMVTMWVTDYLANTAILVYKRENYLNFNITPDMVSGSDLFKLDTTTFSLLVPELYKKYPNKNLTLGVRAVDKPPFIAITPGGANFTLPGAVDFYVMNGDNTPLAFTLGVMAYLDMKASLAVDPKTYYLKISANATYLNADLSVLESNIGDIQVSKIQSLLDSLGKALIIPQINKYTNIGFPIPTVDGLHFINPALSLGKGFAVVETDVSYTS